MIQTINFKRVLQVAIFAVVLTILLSISFIVQAQVQAGVVNGEKASVTTKTPRNNDATPAVQVDAIDDVDSFFKQEGEATWYGNEFHGRKTASGQRYDQHAYTCAHKTLPFGSIVRVSKPGTDEDVLVMVNDRGPYVRGRIIDLSYSSARELGVNASDVKVEAFHPAKIAASRPGFELAFDTENNPVMVARENFDATDTLSDFSSAVRTLKKYRTSSPELPVYLMVTSNESGKGIGQQYYVGVLRNQDVRTSSVERVEYRH